MQVNPSSQFVSVQVTKQPSVPLQVNAPGHSASGSVSALIGEQVPTEPALSQASQVPSQAVLQQTPSTQTLERQSSSLTQAAPLSSRGSQEPETHRRPFSQSEASRQAVMQAPLPSHEKAPGHSASGSVARVAGRHVPSPPSSAQVEQVPSHAVWQHTPSTQWLESQSSFELQVAAMASLATHKPSTHRPSDPHWLDEVQALRQWRAPSQETTPGHSLAGSAPVAIGVQVPRLPVRWQASQVPSHSVLQQRPSTQMPLVQWTSDVQRIPLLAFARHAPFSQ